MSETITDERLAQLVDTLSADNEVAAEALAFETHRARTAETRLAAENKALRASIAAAVKAKEEAEGEKKKWAEHYQWLTEESASLRSQLAQAREANETLRRAVVKLGQPRQFARELCFCNNADKTYCVGMPICKEVRAALSPPSPGSGVVREEEPSLCEELGDLITEAGLKLVIKPPAPTDGGGKR